MRCRTAGRPWRPPFPFSEGEEGNGANTKLCEDNLDFSELARFVSVSGVVVKAKCRGFNPTGKMTGDTGPGRLNPAFDVEDQIPRRGTGVAGAGCVLQWGPARAMWFACDLRGVAPPTYKIRSRAVRAAAALTGSFLSTSLGSFICSVSGGGQGKQNPRSRAEDGSKES